jgi:hypothetical protein
LGAGEAPTAGSPATDVATTAGGLAEALAAPFGAGEGFPSGFALADDTVGEVATVGFAATAAGIDVGFAVALPLVTEAAAVGRGVVVATDTGAGVLAGGRDCATGQQPVSTSRPSKSAESRAARNTGGWYPAQPPGYPVLARRARHDVVPAASKDLPGNNCANERGCRSGGL